jgi:hypothetical protein
MKFMIFVIDDMGNSGTPDEMVQIDAFNEKLQENGQWITAGGLAAPVNANVIDNRKNAGLSTSKSLFDGADFYSGFWLIQAENLEVATQLANEGSNACNRKVELRPLL